ncbi:MAG: hypothetical protein R3324_08570 [Halobacteriales archaeon]|nr:hypothetical protein [Halobacteriales archaeon]
MAYHTNPGGGPIRFEFWERVGGGDGMYQVFDLCNNRYLYNESQFGPIARLDLWTGERKGVRHQDNELRWNWNSPILMSPHDCDVIYHGANRLLRSDYRGETWEFVSPDLTKADPATLTTGKGGDGNIQYATITTVDESPLTAGVLWVGTDDGNVQVSRDGGESWTLVNDNIPGNPEYWVSRVEASNHDAGTAYLSYTGYRRDDFRPFVYKTTDYGETWTSIASNLPMGPVNVVREHHENPDVLAVGTEFGVFVSIDGGASWTELENDLPTTPVQDMHIHPREDDLIVGTHGRGMYIADFNAIGQMTPEILASDAHFFEPESKVRWIGDDRTNYAFTNFAGESEPMEIPLYYHLGSDVAEDVTFAVYYGNTVIAELEGSGDAGVHEVAWGMERREERSAEEQEEMRERFERFGATPSEEQLRWQTSPAPIGDYRVEMRIGDRVVDSHEVSILRDEWWMQRR